MIVCFHMATSKYNLIYGPSYLGVPKDVKNCMFQNNLDSCTQNPNYFVPFHPILL